MRAHQIFAYSPSCFSLDTIELLRATLLREPLLHFVLFGAALFIAYEAISQRESGDANKRIVVSAAEVEWMQNNWEKRWGRPPTAKELDGVIQEYVRETVLYREAVALGLDKNDQIVRRRMAQKMEFIARDVIVPTPESEEEMIAYFESNRDRYREPRRYTFTQVFIDPDRRGDATLNDAQVIKAKLIAEGNTLADPATLGDEFMLASFYPEKTPLELQKLFGSGFVDRLVELSPDQWHGPVLSGYGTHLIFISHITEPPEPVFAEVRERVLADWTAEQSERLEQRFYEDIVARYTIDVDLPVNGDGADAFSEQSP